MGGGRGALRVPHAPHPLTGQHRALGSQVSKVQSLKLDTSVWSNEIVQVRSARREKVGRMEEAHP